MFGQSLNTAKNRANGKEHAATDAVCAADEFLENPDSVPRFMPECIEIGGGHSLTQAISLVPIRVRATLGLYRKSAQWSPAHFTIFRETHILGLASRRNLLGRPPTFLKVQYQLGAENENPGH